jgi:Methyltransferase domain
MNKRKPYVNQSCRACTGQTRYFFTNKVLGLDAVYEKCTTCSSVQVQNPTWIEKAHEGAISAFDTGLVQRSLITSRIIASLLVLEKRIGARGFDWGGGTGLFTRLMRDMGFQVESYDKFTKSVHAIGFEVSGKSVKKIADFVTAIECYEHLTNPIEEFKNVVEKKDYFIFTTEIIETPPPKPPQQNWWYYMPQSGQHITFLSRNGLCFFKKQLGFKFSFSVGNLHILSHKKLAPITRLVLRQRVLRYVSVRVLPEILQKRRSSILSDHEALLHLKQRKQLARNLKKT